MRGSDPPFFFGESTQIDSRNFTENFIFARESNLVKMLL
jgi:hypothetical protein